MTIRMKSIALLLGSTALVTSISSDVLARSDNALYDNSMAIERLNRLNPVKVADKALFDIEPAVTVRILYSSV